MDETWMGEVADESDVRLDEAECRTLMDRVGDVDGEEAEADVWVLIRDGRLLGRFLSDMLAVYLSNVEYRVSNGW